MKPSVRLRICSNCGHLILRSATSSQGPFKSRPIRAESQRSISWRSLFDVLTKSEKPDASTNNPKAVNQDSRARTKAAVQRLRETRDQTRRPLNPSVSPSERESAQCLFSTTPNSSTISLGPATRQVKGASESRQPKHETTRRNNKCNAKDPITSPTTKSNA